MKPNHLAPVFKKRWGKYLISNIDRSWPFSVAIFQFGKNPIGMPKSVLPDAVRFDQLIESIPSGSSLPTSRARNRFSKNIKLPIL